MNRIVVTGIGLRAPDASKLSDFWEVMNAPAIRRPAEIDLGVALRNSSAFRAQDGTGEAASRATRLAEAALRDALHDAALPDGDGAGLFLGTSLGNIDLFESGGQDVDTDMAGRYALCGALAGSVGINGPVEVVSTACASSLYAIGAALDRLRNKEMDIAVAGGVELCCRIGHACFNRLGALDPERCRPFDAHRRGTAFGEGAAFLVLEREEHALARGLTGPWITVDGFGWSCDAHHITAPSPGGATMLAAAQDALARAGRRADDIAVVLPHGTGTAHNDEVEAACLETLLGERLGEVPLFPLKALIGHTAAAAGVFGCIAAALILKHGTVPGNAWLDEPAFPGLCLPEHPVALPGAASALVNAYAFGGNNASILMGTTAHG